MSQRSAGSCTRCTRANAFPDQGPIFFTVKYEATISNLQMELKSVKSQSDTTLARLTQIENRLADLEQGTYLEDRSNDDDYYYDSNPPENFDSQNY